MDIIDSISNVGFPVVACIYLVYYQSKVIKNLSDEIELLRKAIENNTKIINEFLK